MPILDIEQLEDLRYLTPTTDDARSNADDAPDPVGNLIRLFQSKALERMNLMEGMLARSDWHHLAETSHSLRGASASMGFPRVAVLCKDLENGARALEHGHAVAGAHMPAPEELSILLGQIKSRYAEAERAMQDWIADNLDLNINTNRVG